MKTKSVKLMTSKMYVVFGASQVGMAIMAALLAKGNKVRMVNRRGIAI